MNRSAVDEPTASTPAAVPQNHKEISGWFAHGTGLVAGEYEPCFYCGCRKHRATHCPSKELPYGSSALERLGFLSMDEINRLFSDYLSESGKDLPVIPKPPSKESGSLTFLAPWSFYELKKVFQLRFLDLVWNASPRAAWTKARDARGEQLPQNAALWSARDCMRTSRLEEAKELLGKYDRANKNDYRVPCGFAFVEIEDGRLASAADYLNEALNRSIGKLQRSYLLLLLFRVYSLIPNLWKADEKLKEALGTDLLFHEAIFQHAIRCFQDGRDAEGVKRLVKLIGTCRDYYPAVLISPELAEYRESIAPELQNLATLTKHEAHEAAREADRDLTALKGFVGQDDAALAEIVSWDGQLRTSMNGPESAFNYYGAIDVARRISAACGEVDRERADNVWHAIKKIEALVEETAQRSRTLKALALFGPIHERLMRLEKDLKVRSPIAVCLSECDKVEMELAAVSTRARKLDTRGDLMRVLALFVKDVILSSFITVAVGLVLFPGALSLLHLLRPDSTLETAQAWLFQKAILIIGSILSVLLAGVRALLGKRSSR